MTTAALVAKAARDRCFGMAIATTVLMLFLLYAMAVYRGIDLSVYTDLPEGIRELFGIPAGADAASLSYNVMLGFAGALTLAGMAIAFGSSAIAGAERDGTIGLLLANPVSRSRVLLAQLVAMLALVAAAGGLLYVAARAVPALLDVDIGSSHVAAAMLHMGLNAIFYGTLALAVGAWTGRRAAAAGVSAGVMIVSYFAVGLLPLVERFADGARAFPWYYFDRSDPLVNGVAWGHVAVLGGGAALFVAGAVVGVNRRDLRARDVGRSLLDRLREHATTGRTFDRLAGSTRVSRIWIKSTSEHQPLLVITAFTMFALMGLLMGPMFAAIEESIASLGEDFPEAVLAIAGGGDLATPEGFLQTETFSIMAPIAVMTVTIVIGAKGIAGEEADRTMGLLLANPIPRRMVVFEQTIAMVVDAVVVGAATFAGVALGSVLAGLGVSVIGIAATSALVVLLGLVFGALALALSAATGLVRVGVFGAIGVALTSHMLNAFLPLNDELAAYARWTPHHWYLSGDPLRNGMPWGHAAMLTALFLALVAVAVVAFDRRDLRHG